MDPTNEGAATLLEQRAAQGIIQHDPNPTTAARARQGASAATASGSGQGGRRWKPRANIPTGSRVRKPLTTGQRGRFWQSVGDAIKAARKAGHS